MSQSRGKKMKHNNVSTELLLMDSSGIYIPQRFVDEYTNVCDENGNALIGSILSDIEICKNSDNVLYWEAWENILNNVYLKINDDIYMLHHNQDLWAIKKDDVDSLNESESDKFWESLSH